MSDDRSREKFTSDARQALEYARPVSRTYHLPAMGDELILLGLLQDRDGVATRALAEHGIQASTVQTTIERILEEGAASADDQPHWTPRAKAAINTAIGEAQRRQHRQIGPEHLFLGLLRDRRGVLPKRRSNAVRILESLGVARRDLEQTVAGIADTVIDRQ